MLQLVILKPAFGHFLLWLASCPSFVIHAKSSPHSENVVRQERRHEVALVTLVILPVGHDNFVRDLLIGRFTNERGTFQKKQKPGCKGVFHVILRRSQGIDEFPERVMFQVLTITREVADAKLSGCLYQVGFY